MADETGTPPSGGIPGSAKGKRPGSDARAAGGEAKSGLADESEQVRVRLGKLQSIRDRGENPYKNGFAPNALASELHASCDGKNNEALLAEGRKVAVAGRVMAVRDFGKAGFVHLKDRTGRIQFYAKKDKLGEEGFARYRELDLGDLVFTEGPLFRTKMGELSVESERVVLLAKALRPLPEKFHGLTDVERRYRQRYVDLIMSDESRSVFLKRARVIEEIRRFFLGRDFLEVETPMMHPIAGGAAARPFVTHHNALDVDLFLRIAPELYLKRLVVGGFERVFEINRNFRNEGISIKHNPEFTMLEFYQAYATFEDLMSLTEELFRLLARTITGAEKFAYQGAEIDFAPAFRRAPMESLILELSGFQDRSRLRDRQALFDYCEKRGYPAFPAQPVGALQAVIFEEEVEAKLVQPTFVTHYPYDISPLSRRNEKDPFLTDRFELIVYGREMANGFSELNDPIDQRERFLAQAQAKAAGDAEACEMDEDYVTALEHGMPPTAGEGIGIDRLVMLLTDSASIRDVILFPQMRPE